MKAITIYLGRPLVHISLIAAIVLAAYSNTFHVPFLFDDNTFIVQNPLLADARFILHPEESGVDILSINVAETIHTRTVAYLSFIANLLVHGMRPEGFHIFNLLVHFANALLIYLIVALTFLSPALKGSVSEAEARTTAFLSALIFAAHPVQTQAVTYISQRFASMGAMFYIGSVVAYAGSRLSAGPGRKQYLLYALSILMATLAMKTKENCFTLPVTIALYEHVFFGGPLRQRVMLLAPLFATMLIIPMSLMVEIAPGALVPSNNPAMPHHEYLALEARAMLTYLRLLVLPVNQKFEYDTEYTTYDRAHAVEITVSVVLVLVALGYAFYSSILRRYPRPWVRPVAFGVSWFFISISVESSIIPQGYLIDEHRAYLPSAGLIACAGMAGAMVLHGRRQALMALAIAVLSVALVFASTTFVRNKVYATEISAWEEYALKAPRVVNVRLGLAEAYRKAGLVDEAVGQYRLALDLAPEIQGIHIAIAVLLESEGRTAEAIEEYGATIRKYPYFFEAYDNLGDLYDRAGQTDLAIKTYRAAIANGPEEAILHYNLARICERSGRTDEAAREFRKVAELDHSNAETR